MSFEAIEGEYGEEWENTRTIGWNSGFMMDLGELSRQHRNITGMMGLAIGEPSPPELFRSVCFF